MTMANGIFPSELVDLLKSGTKINLIDVRTPAEFQEFHLAGARNIPLHQLDPEVIQNQYPNAPLYVICQKGGRGRKACERLVAAGLSNVVNVEGGVEGCVAAGVPVLRGRQRMSLERQVRIAAGSLVLLGLVLAWIAHPIFIALSAFVGAGLVFAGVTDTCGMGMLLARMPWNQTKTDAGCDTTVGGNIKANTP
jgi:rhodanese-related sulfurtransferase